MSVAHKNKIYKITVTAIFSSISALFMFLSFSLPGFPGFLRFEISDLPALIITFALGPTYGVCVVLIKNIIHLFFTSTGGIGEFCNFIVGAIFVFSAGFIYKYKKTKSGAFIGMLTATIIMTLISTFLNYYVFIPIYSLIIPVDSIIELVKAVNPYIDTLLKVILVTVVPFNFIKGIVISVLTFIMYKKLTPIIKGNIK